mgnify:CR=1 FL=1
MSKEYDWIDSEPVVEQPPSTSAVQFLTNLLWLIEGQGEGLVKIIFTQGMVENLRDIVALNKEGE